MIQPINYLNFPFYHSFTTK